MHRRDRGLSQNILGARLMSVPVAYRLADERKQPIERSRSEAESAEALVRVRFGRFGPGGEGPC